RAMPHVCELDELVPSRPVLDQLVTCHPRQVFRLLFYLSTSHKTTATAEQQENRRNKPPRLSTHVTRLRLSPPSVRDQTSHPQLLPGVRDELCGSICAGS